jgi:Ca-activated chloride channel family protein
VRRAGRIALAVGATLLALALGLVYPFAARGDSAWFAVTWQHPWALVLLAVVPVVWWWGTFGQDRRTPRLRIGSVASLLSGPRGLRAHLRDLPGVLRAGALVFFIAALARPVSVLKDESRDEKGIDIMVVMDLSGSMRAVLDTDVRDPGKRPQPHQKRLTRIDTAKLVVKDFIERRKTDRIGVIVFGKSAYVLSPPTLDYHLLTQLVSKIQLGVIDGNATAIGDAVGAAAARLKRSDAKSKVIILLTDGDSNAGLVSPDYATHLAGAVGAKVYTIQIGNEDEVDVEDGTDLFGQPVYSRQRFPVNPALLQKMARDTGGKAFVATDSKALSDSMHAVLDHLERTRFESSVAQYEDLFAFLLVPGVALVALDALLRAFLLRRFP